MFKTSGIYFPLLALLAAVLGNSSLLAGPITGVTVAYSGSVCCGESPQNLVNGSGLVGGYNTSALNQPSGASGITIQSFSNPVPEFTFNLQGNRQLSQIAFWNYSGIFPQLSINALLVSTSLNGTDFTPIPSITNLTQGGSGPQAAEIFSFGIPLDAAFVRVAVLSNYGAFGAVLQEVMFVEVAVPEPGTMILSSLALASLIAYRRLRHT
jgi:hypothetical protein